METEAVVKRWGNSLGVVLPSDVVKQRGLYENDRVLLTVVKAADLSDMFGALKRKKTGQAFKDMVRDGWK